MDNMMDEIRIESRLRNNLIWNAIFPIWGNVRKFCEATGMQGAVVGQYLNFRRSPFKMDHGQAYGAESHWTGEYKDSAKKLAELCGYCCEELYPVELYQRVIPPKAVKTISLAKVLALRSIQEGVEMKQVTDFRMMESNGSLDKAIATLTEREQIVIRARWGLSGNGRNTLAETGKRLKVGKERIRQIEGKAIRRLRHPSLCRLLKDTL